MMHALKSHRSAVCIIPPLPIQEAIQRIRCFKDKSFVRWPPHINLLYPFFEDKELTFEHAASMAAEALAHLPPFKVRLKSLAFFEHSSSYTLWMDAADSSGLIGVQAALQARFPSCNDLSDDPQRSITSFTPHLSLGQWQNKQQLLAAIQEYSSNAESEQLLDLQFEVNEVCICSRQGYRDPFTIRYAVPLGTATPSAPYIQPQRVDVPYIATTTPNYNNSNNSMPTGSLTDASSSRSRSPRDRGRFGLGAAPAGIWNFAYGSNMSPRKLGGSRGLHPQESRPAVLRGHKLLFNHRGGFGNIVPIDEAAAAAGGGSANGGADDATAAAASPVSPVPVPGDVHGVLHRLTPADMADLMCMEHEYEPVVVMVRPYNSEPQQQVPELPEQQQQQELIPAIAFSSPLDRCIKDDLPPTQRYLDLLREGARHWKLDAQYTTWLEQHAALADGADRGAEYYTAPTTGEPLPAWPKIRTGGSQQQQHGGKQRGRHRGRGGRQGGQAGGGSSSSRGTKQK